MIITCSPFKFVKYNRPRCEAQQYLRKFPQCINYKIIETNISKPNFPLVQINWNMKPQAAEAIHMSSNFPVAQLIRASYWHCGSWVQTPFNLSPEFFKLLYIIAKIAFITASEDHCFTWCYNTLNSSAFECGAVTLNNMIITWRDHLSVHFKEHWFPIKEIYRNIMARVSQHFHHSDLLFVWD